MSTLAGGLVGREVQRAAFDDVLAAAVGGRGGCLAVSGEAGIGKTRLCEAFTDAALSAGVGVAWAACWPSAASAFAPWAELLVQVDGRPVEVEGVTAHDPALGRTALFADVLGRLREAAAQRPRLLVIDDLHWADEATALLTAHVLPALRGMPVMLVVALREDELAAHAVAGLGDGIRRHAQTLALPGLSVEETGALVALTTGGSVTRDVAARVYEATGGNPLFARELAVMLSAERVPDGGSVLAVRQLPGSVRDVLTARVRALTPACRRFLEVVAVLADSATPTLVAEVAGEGIDAVLGGLDEALRAGVLTAAESRIDFAHPLLRAGVLEAVSLEGRVRLHARAGEALIDAKARGQPVEPGTVAHHLLEAAAGGSVEAAVSWAVRAADEAMSALAYETAAALLAGARRALALDAAAGDRAAVLLGLGDAQAASGRGEDAERAYREAIDLARQQDRPDVLARAVLGLTGGMGFEVPVGDLAHHDLLHEARAAIAGRDPALDSLLTARLSVSLSFAAPVAERRRLAEQAVAAARTLDDLRVLAVTLAAFCDAVAGPDGLEQRLAATQEILRIARHTEDLALELLGRRLRVVALLERGDVDDVDAEIDRYVAAAGRLGQAGYSWYVPLWRGMRDLMRGQLVTYRRHRARLAELVDQAGSLNAQMLLLSQAAMAALLHAGDAGEPFGRLVALTGGPDGVLPGPQLAIGEALVAATTGDRDRAGMLLDRCADALCTAEPDSEWLPMLVQTAEVLANLGEDRADLAGWLHDTLAPYAGLYAVEGIGAFVNGQVGRAVGLMAALLGRSDEARRRLEAAARAEEGIGATALAERTRRQATRLPERPAQPGTSPTSPRGVADASGVFRREGDSWRLDYAGTCVHVRDSKGVRDLAVLLATPGRGVPALDLATAAGTRRRPPDREVGAQPPGDLGEVLDAPARAAYRQRVAAIEDELGVADRHGDAERSARLAAERDALLAELAGAYGLGGRPRRTGHPAERARTAVTARIRDAIRRIADVHPALGAHLRHAVRTGTVCCYDPEVPTRWRT